MEHASLDERTHDELTQELQARIQTLTHKREEIQALHSFIEAHWGAAPPIPQWEMPDTDTPKEEGV